MIPSAISTDRDRQRDRLVRSIAQSQLLTSAALLLMAVFAVVVSAPSLGNPLFFGAISLLFVVTGLAVLVPWTLHTKSWAVILPVLDIIAIIGLREGLPELGPGLFLVFPVIWMSRNFGLAAAIGGVALSTGLLWLTWWLGGDALAVSDFAGLIVLPIALAFIATTIFATTRRTTGQRILLRTQATLTEAAFARARAQERTLEEILNAVQFGVVAFNAEGAVTMVNESHRQSLTAFGAARSAITYPSGYQADRITPIPDAARPFFRAQLGQQYDDLTMWVGEPGADRAAYSVTARELTTPAGDGDGMVVVLQDVTAELDAIQARDNLISTVSHELRTPLTSILGYLELALDDPRITPETHRMVDIAHRNSERLLTLVTDLLLAASDADKTLSLTFERCDIAVIAAQALEDQRVVADASQVALIATEVEPAFANVDPVRIRQVMDNLLSNAIKYNRAGGTVTVAVEHGASAVRVRVTDTGVGLTPAEQGQLFDRFYRTESARRSLIHGSGLGMGISREIVRQHGGDLTLTSTPDVGTTFFMTVPTLENAEK